MKNEIDINKISKDKLNLLLKNFESISLKNMNNVALLNRAETKYVMSFDNFLNVLSELPKDYMILEVKDNRQNNYQTIYYDTEDFAMYNKHHNGVLNRYKIRSREYLDSELFFMEVKFKNNKNKTIKKRLDKSKVKTNFKEERVKFVHDKSNFEFNDLMPVLWNKYTRITLVSKKNIERLTFDINLEFLDIYEDKSVNMNNLVIAEIKQEGFSQNSDFIKLMHSKSIRSTGFSKYCIGTSLIYENLKSNNFKEKLLLVNKIGGIVQ